MKTVVRMPLLVRGQPARNNGLRDIFVVKEVSWDIPEVSRSETEVAFTTRQKWRRFESGMLGPDTQYDIHPCEARTELREYDGALYKRIATTEEEIRKLLSTAFPSTWAGNLHHEDNEISFDPTTERHGNPMAEGGISPVSNAVYRQLDWHRSCCRYVDERDPELVWPISPRPRRADLTYIGNNTRNNATFEDVLPNISHFDTDQFEACLDLYPQQLSRLLMVEGELWIRTPPPIYRVKPLFETGKTSALIHMCLAPDIHDTDMTSALFSLSSRDEAIEYARRLAELSALERQNGDHNWGGDRGHVYDTHVDFEVSDDLLIAYDHEAEELRRLSCALAVETRRFSVRNPGWLEKRKIAEETVNGCHASFDQVLATNYVTGEYGDASPWLESNLSFFKRTGRKHSIYKFGTVARTDLMVDRVRDFSENAPIHIGLSAIRNTRKADF
jgi:hypothetical protein